jgi:uncharacterized alpha/beta hydrolase family protein
MDITQNTKTIIYSFTAGYMVSQFDILGFAMGCGVMLAFQFIPDDIKKLKLEIFTKTFNLANHIMDKKPPPPSPPPI